MEDYEEEVFTERAFGRREITGSTEAGSGEISYPALIICGTINFLRRSMHTISSFFFISISTPAGSIYLCIASFHLIRRILHYLLIGASRFMVHSTI